MDSTEKIDIVQILGENANDGSISCPVAFKLVNQYSFFPDMLGVAMNSNKIRITECQLGLFGHNGTKKVKPADSVTDELEDKIYSNLDNEKLPCAAAWHIADEMKMSKFEVACACEKLKIKIFKCQLGAF